ncbi:unnamed protein product [Rhizoctonia solani]|uniref:Kex protein n=1 Tax=Rhizoctonia solani TaxID=456999 RepID=A0A8H3A6T3_9AGAM|nr:unnamed protein product [Rhizoctonia solani]
MYAFVRNTFAVAAIAILIFRTITALLQAQNEIGTRVNSAICGDRASKLHKIGVLMDRVPSPRQTESIGITLSASWSNIVGRNYELYGTSSCNVQWSGGRSRQLTLYVCDGAWTDRLGNYNEVNDLFHEGWGKMLAYHIGIQAPLPVMLGGEVVVSVNKQMPYVWLLNTNELPSNFSQAFVDEVRFYQTPWELLLGSHIEAEAKLITRRFIKSSIMKDIILNSEPEYRSLSLYPIAESSVVALNSSNGEVATATIRTSLTPGLMSLRRQEDVKVDRIDNWDSSGPVCDFIEDYRSGTVVDVIGSVGGLFALLQALNVLLFGRPLLWGLTGVKSIAPFGLIGAFSSKGFKQRLREEYHGTSTEDGMDTIKIVKFLRDFVIEFGPADLDLEPRSPRRPTPPPKEGDQEEGTTGTQM